MAKIFISYRRDDSIATTGRLRDRLVQEFGRSNVFVDVDDIPHGWDFVKILTGKVNECDLLLAMIGPNWLDVRDGQGMRRIEFADDFVRLEIASALSREAIAVVPVLIDGARLPAESELPEPLRSLARRNAIELRNTQFGSDSDRLIRSIRAALPARAHRISHRAAWMALAIAVVLAGIGAWRFLPTPAFPPPIARPAATPASDGIEAAVRRLRQSIEPGEANIDISIRGGNRIRLGNEIVFEVESRVPGRLILVDVNAAGEVTQIFPNRFSTLEATARVQPGIKARIPGAGYGFTGFKAVEPVGRSQLLAVIVPDDVTPPQLAMIREQGSKGLEPVAAPADYLDQLKRLVALGSADVVRKYWGLAALDYEIVR